MAPRRTEQLHQRRAAGSRVRPMSRRTILIALVVGLGTAACGGTSAPPASLGPDDIISLQRAERIIQSNLTAEEHALINNANSVVTEECMQELGWDFRFGRETPETNSGGPDSLSALDQWTFADVPFAESAGYGLEAYLAELSSYLDLLREMDSEARIPDPTTMKPEDAGQFELDYFGTEEERVEIVERDGSNASVAGGGCVGTAFRAVWGDIAQELNLRDARGTAESDIWVTTLADDMVADTLDAWKDCVAEDGFEFDDPQQAFDSAISAAQSGDFQRERVIAVADARCKGESGLDDAARAAFLAATNAVLPDLEDDLLAYQQSEAETLQRAKDILGLGD